MFYIHISVIYMLLKINSLTNADIVSYVTIYIYIYIYIILMYF